MNKKYFSTKSTVLIKTNNIQSIEESIKTLRLTKKLLTITHKGLINHVHNITLIIEYSYFYEIKTLNVHELNKSMKEINKILKYLKTKQTKEPLNEELKQLITGGLIK